MLCSCTERTFYLSSSGDSTVIRLFPEEPSFPQTSVLLPGANPDRATISLTQHARFLHTIKGKALEYALQQLGKALPNKQRPRQHIKKSGRKTLSQVLSLHPCAIGTPEIQTIHKHLPPRIAFAWFSTAEMR
eukprot:903368-Prymnesium_polylepis.1